MSDAVNNVVDSYCWSECRKILTPEQTGLPVLRTFGLSFRQQAGHPLNRHLHADCIEIVYMLSGFQTYEAGDSCFPLSGRDIFVAYPDEPHGSGGYLENVCDMIWLQLDLTPGLPFLGLSGERADELRRALLSLPRLFSGDDALMHMLRESFFSLASPDPFERFCGEQLLVCALQRTKKCADRPLMRQSDRISSAVSYIHEHLSDALSLESVAAACSLSLPRFKVCFRAETGVTPREYINQVKIRQAQRLLASGLSVTETAMSLGFTTSNYFSVLFRKYTCMTPTQYVRRASSGPDGE